MESQHKRLFKYPIDGFTICAVMILFQRSILLFLGYVGNRIGLRDVPLAGVFVFWFVFVIAGASLFISNYQANIRIDVRKISFPLIVCIINLLSVLYTSLLNKYIFETIQFDIIQYVLLLPVIVAVFCGIGDYEKLNHWLTVVARVAWIMPFLNIYTGYSRSGNSFETYDMVGGYELVFCSMILLRSVFKRFNFLDLLLCAVTFIVALGCGSRGSVLAFVVYLSILIFTKFYADQKRIYKIAFVALALIIVLVLLLCFDGIVLGLKGVFNGIGVSTRTLDSLLYSSIVEGSNENRRMMYETVVRSWKSMPITGHGILYDRMIVGIYCHNIVIEIITDFGFALGTVFIAWFIFSMARSLLYADSNKKSFIVMLTCFILTQLLVSGTYLTSNEFFALLGAIAITSRNTQGGLNLFKNKV